MVFQLTYTTLYEYRFGAPHCSHMRFESKHRIVTSVLADPFHMCCPLWEAWLTILGCPKYVLTVNRRKPTPCSYCRCTSTYLRGPVGLKSIMQGQDLGYVSLSWLSHDPNFARQWRIIFYKLYYKPSLKPRNLSKQSTGALSLWNDSISGPGFSHRIPPVTPSLWSLCSAKGEDAEVFRQPETGMHMTTYPSRGCRENSQYQ